MLIWNLQNTAANSNDNNNNDDNKVRQKSERCNTGEKLDLGWKKMQTKSKLSMEIRHWQMYNFAMSRMNYETENHWNGIGGQHEAAGTDGKIDRVVKFRRNNFSD